MLCGFKHLKRKEIQITIIKTQIFIISQKYDQSKLYCLTLTMTAFALVKSHTIQEKTFVNNCYFPYYNIIAKILV